MTFLHRLEQLTEFAMRLSVAKNFLKEAKSDPMVQPFLVNGKIKRGNGSHFAPPIVGVSKTHKTAGITIERGESHPLEVLAHEYGHAKDSAENLRQHNRYDRIASRVGKPDFKISPKKNRSKISDQLDRMRYSRTLTRERVATLGGAESLSKAGANLGELADYFKAINPHSSEEGFRLMHPTYEQGYWMAKLKDKKQRLGGSTPIRGANLSKKLYGE